MEQQAVSISGLCECGCRQITTISQRTDKTTGHTKGQPNRFVAGHGIKPKGKDSYRWKGGKFTTSKGYVLIKQPDHPRADSYGYVLEHVLIAEKAFGKPLPPEVEIHHANEKKTDNANSNLVVCPDRAYHMLLHQRLRALKACGNPNWRKCRYCQRFDDPSHLSLSGRWEVYHKKCKSEHELQRLSKKRLFVDRIA